MTMTIDGFETLQNEIVAKMVDEIQAKTTAAIVEALVSLGIEVDLIEERKRRFSRFVSEQNGDSRTIWFNDGSIEGIRVITFVEEIPSVFDNKMSCTLKYY